MITKEIKIKDLVIGGNNHIVIQSMTTCKTSNIHETIKQINDLASVGCEIVRVSVLDMIDAVSLKEIVASVSCPIIADIHYDYKLALVALDYVHKIRINPGNMKKEELNQVIDKAKEKQIPIRIGVNSGSITDEDKAQYPDIVTAMLAKLKEYVAYFEERGFTDLILSCKCSDVQTTIKTNILISENFPYPIHIGLTEAGPLIPGTVKNSYVISTLLNRGIGSTIRVSLTEDSVMEVKVAKEILKMNKMYDKVEIISCPTCGRCQIDLKPIVEEISRFVEPLHANLKVAIMGCVVNGPGEAKDCDLGIAGGKGKAVLFKHGEIVKTIDEKDIIECLKQEIMEIING